MASAAVVAAAVLAPLALATSGNFVAGTRATAEAAGNAIFQPWQLWWFFGHHGALVHGLLGAPKPGYRMGPAWAGAVSHPLILAAGLAIVAALWPRSRRTALLEQDALLALALALLLRCLLDTWDTVYYSLPFVLAMLTWEAGRPTRNPPVLALAASTLVWVSFQWLPLHVSADVQATVFLAWSLPLAVWLGLRLFTPRHQTLALSLGEGDRVRAHETTVSALGRPVRST